MYDELIFMIFSGEGGAGEAWSALEKIHEGQLFKLVDIVLINRDRTGKVAFQLQRKIIDVPDDQDRRITLMMAEAIFDNSTQVALHQISEAGVDRMFLQDVTQALKPDTSAFLIYVPGDRLIDTRTYLASLSKLRGTPYQTTFPSTAKESILEQG